MKIKTYIVNTLPEAYPMIFQDLGKDAIILKTKRIKQAGFFGFLRKKQLEVVAASDLAVEEKKEMPAAAQESSVVLKAEGEGRLDPQHEVLKELSEVKGLIRSITLGEKGLQAIPQELDHWVNRLRDQEVDEAVIQFIVKKVKLTFEGLEMISAEVLEQALLTILEQLIAEGIAQPSDTHPDFITLVGPTGVGKTTTIAKLAAARVLHGRQKVGLLTTDTYRIAAVEQLKTYANILNVPIEVVENPDHLETAMSSLKGCQIILMDSAGRNYLEDEYIEEINQYLSFDAPQENYLVLSMTTRWRDMKQVIEKMKSVPIDKMILTKWDETTCYGAALNLLYHYPYPLAFLSVGQGVPQDIMPANATFMAKKILGVDEHAAARSGAQLETVI